MNDAEFEQLLSVTLPAMTLAATRLVGPDRADEAVQHAAINAFARRTLCQLDKNPHKWLLAFVRNACLKIVQPRRWTRSTASNQDEFLASLPDTHPLPDAVLSNAEEVAGLYAPLSPDERRIVDLVAVQGYSQWEAVRRLQLWPTLTEGARRMKVGRVYKRALQKMRDQVLADN